MELDINKEQFAGLTSEPQNGWLKRSAHDEYDRGTFYGTFYLSEGTVIQVRKNGTERKLCHVFWVDSFKPATDDWSE